MVDPVILPDRIRARCRFRVGGREIAKGEEVALSDELPWAEVAPDIECRNAVAVFDLAPFEPDGPPAEGWSLAEAYRAHVAKHPRVRELSKATRRAPPEPPRRLGVWLFKKPRAWQLLLTDLEKWHIAKRRRLRRGARDSVYLDVIPGPAPFIPRYYQACWPVFVHAAIHNFLGRLERGALVVDGTKEPLSDLTLERESLARDLWRRGELVIGFGSDALFRVPAGGKKPELFLSDVRVCRGEGVVIDSPTAPQAMPDARPPLPRRPRPRAAPPLPRHPVGRPSRREDIRTAYERLEAAGDLNACETLSEAYPLVRSEVCRVADNKEDESGLADEAIRKAISALFQQFVSARKSAHKL